jgi:hypothetical protein
MLKICKLWRMQIYDLNFPYFGSNIRCEIKRAGGAVGGGGLGGGTRERGGGGGGKGRDRGEEIGVGGSERDCLPYNEMKLGIFKSEKSRIISGQL